MALNSDENQNSAPLFEESLPPREKLRPLILRVSITLTAMLLCRFLVGLLPNSTARRLLGILAAYLLPTLFLLFLPRKKRVFRILSGFGYRGMILFFPLLSVVMLFSAVRLLSGSTESVGFSVGDACISVFLVPLVEEIAFRFVLLPELLPAGKQNAAFVTAIFFALCHADTVSLGYALIAGILLAIAAMTSESLILPFVLHSGVNLVSVILSALPAEITLWISFFVLLVSVVLTIILFGKFRPYFCVFFPSPEEKENRKILLFSPLGVLLLLYILTFILTGGIR